MAEQGDGIDISSRMKYHRGTVQKKKIQTIKTSMEIGVIDGKGIRMLTEREAFRFMGFTDEDYEKAAEVTPPRTLYKQAGNSIVVQVLEAIFKELL